MHDANIVLLEFQPRVKSIILYCFKAVKHKLKCKLGFFDLYGLDFMVDEDMKVNDLISECP